MRKSTYEKADFFTFSADEPLLSSGAGGTGDSDNQGEWDDVTGVTGG